MSLKKRINWDKFITETTNIPSTTSASISFLLGNETKRHENCLKGEESKKTRLKVSWFSHLRNQERRDENLQVSCCVLFERRIENGTHLWSSSLISHVNECSKRKKDFFSLLEMKLWLSLMMMHSLPTT